MDHFIYAMNSKDPAPAAGGDTKSWFLHYKWDVDDFTFVPVPEDKLIDFSTEGLGKPTTLWFVLDEVILGCAPIHAFMPSLNGSVELHYDTRLMQVKPEGVELTTPDKTGMAPDRSLYEALKRSFDAQYPPRDQVLAAEPGLVQSN